MFIQELIGVLVNRLGLFINRSLCYRKIKTKTGEWHRDLVRKRSRGKSLDIPSNLYRRISIDLCSIESRRLSRDRSSLCSSPCSSRPSTNSRMSSHQDNSLDLVEEWEPTGDGVDGSFFKSTLVESEEDQNNCKNAVSHSL